MNEFRSNSKPVWARHIRVFHAVTFKNYSIRVSMLDIDRVFHISGLVPWSCDWVRICRTRSDASVAPRPHPSRA